VLELTREIAGRILYLGRYLDSSILVLAPPAVGTFLVQPMPVVSRWSGVGCILTRDLVTDDWGIFAEPGNRNLHPTGIIG
jgi:hypothetical protein